MTPADFLAAVHAKAQAQRFDLVQLIPQPEVSESDWGYLLAEPLLEMLTEESHA